jgi:predicted DNA-binding transcriptional regulator AlpA
MKLYHLHFTHGYSVSGERQAWQKTHKAKALLQSAICRCQEVEASMPNGAALNMGIYDKHQEYFKKPATQLARTMPSPVTVQLRPVNALERALQTFGQQLTDLARKLATLTVRLDAYEKAANSRPAEVAPSAAVQQQLKKTILSIDEFCKRNGMSRTTFYTLGHAGQGPRLMKVGRKVWITVESEQDWRRKVEGQSR